MEMMEPDLPPASRMEGIDLITEGILTLSRVESLLSGDGGEGQRRGGPADQILQMLADSDKITFLVGTRINIAHQDPTLPVEPGNTTQRREEDKIPTRNQMAERRRHYILMT